MAVKAKLTGEVNPERTYPYLGKAKSGEIVLFTSRESGFNVNGIEHEVGHHSISWNPYAFTPLSEYEYVTLRNN
jgi:hypothetical protein